MLKALAVVASLALLGGIPAQAIPQPAVDTAPSAHARLQLTAGRTSKGRSGRSKNKSKRRSSGKKGKGSRKTYYQPQAERSLTGDSVQL
jgi:hypothetical protein